MGLILFHKHCIMEFFRPNPFKSIKIEAIPAAIISLSAEINNLSKSLSPRIEDSVFISDRIKGKRTKIP